jgi:hypothetical protein
MALIANDVFDAALNEIATGTTIHICSAEPANFAGIAAVSLGTATPSFTGPADGDVSGRKITIDAVTNGSVTSTDTATSFAIDDGAVLLVAGDLQNPQGVTSGNTFTLTAFDVEFPDPA